MRIFSNIILYVILIFLIPAAIITFLILGVREGYFDKQVKSGIELYFSRVYNTQLDIEGLSVNHKGLTIKKATLSLPQNNYLNVDNFQLKPEFREFFKKLIVTAKINIDKLLIINQKQEEVLNTGLAIHHKFSFRTFNDILTLNLNEISGSGLTDPKGANLPAGTAICQSKSNFLKRKTSNCEIKFGNDSYIRFEKRVRGKYLSAKASVHNIPIMVYQAAARLAPKNEVIQFLQEYVRAGYITDGEFTLNLDEDFWQRGILTERNLQGKFNVTGLEYQYDRDFLPLKNVDLAILLAGPTMKFNITKGYIGQSVISACAVNLDWKGEEKSIAFVKATLQGKAADLTTFISAQGLERAKKNGIDLKTIQGNATTRINMEIPVAPGTPNIYDVSSTVSGVGLKIFDNNIELGKAKITGTFDGYKVALKGDGRINGFDSTFTYQYNLEEQKDYEHLLQVKTALKGSNTKIGMVKMLSGNANVRFEYKSKGEKADISLTSDLKNMEFYLNKISIYKNIGEAAVLNLKGTIDDTLSGKATLSLSGSHNLKIIGNITGTRDRYNIILPVIKSEETSLKGKVSFAPGSFTADIEGEELDLSEANMMQFLEKERDSTNTKLSVKVDKVRLKNNILLTDFALNIECDKVKCFKGYLNSKIGTKNLTMSLAALEDKEEWLINTGNAGAVFLGIDMFKDMRAGAATIRLETKRRQAKKGEEVPIVDGTFRFEKFILTNQSFLAQLVSYISVPGLMNLITNNKNIRFDKFTGKFDFVGNTLQIVDGVAEGQYFDFTMKGRIDTSNRQIDLRGQVVPSVYGISTLLTKLPVLGKIFSGGHRKGIFSAPYKVNKKY